MCDGGLIVYFSCSANHWYSYSIPSIIASAKDVYQLRFYNIHAYLCLALVVSECCSSGAGDNDCWLLFVQIQA
jgi:hypothetical protein